MAQRFRNARKFLHPRNYFRKEQFLITAFMKFGSTYLTQLVAESRGIPVVRLFEQGGHAPQIISPQRLRLVRHVSFASQIHLRYDGVVRNELTSYALLRQQDVKIIVLVRDIFDCLASLHDHVTNETHRNPAFFLNKKIEPGDDIYDFLADMAAPWYVDFFVLWKNAPDCVFCTYEELTSDPERMLARILGDDAPELAEVPSDVFVRKNKGTGGHGQQIPEDIRGRVSTLTRRYPEIASSEIGL